MVPNFQGLPAELRAAIYIHLLPDDKDTSAAKNLRRTPRELNQEFDAEHLRQCKNTTLCHCANNLKKVAMISLLLIMLHRIVHIVVALQAGQGPSQQDLRACAIYHRMGL